MNAAQHAAKIVHGAGPLMRLDLADGELVPGTLSSSVMAGSVST